MNVGDELPGLAAKRAAIRQLLAEALPSGYGQAYPQARAWHEAAQLELAAALEPALNEHLAGLPQQTIVQMRDLATCLNADLKQLGLAVRCPVSGRPSWLVAETKSALEPDVCRYRFQESGDGGRPKRHSACRTLPHLSLTSLPVRVESFARRYRGQDRSHDDDGGTQR